MLATPYWTKLLYCDLSISDVRPFFGLCTLQNEQTMDQIMQVCNARFNLRRWWWRNPFMDCADGFSPSESLVTICSPSPTDEISHDYDDDEDDQHHTYANGHTVVWLVGLAQVNYRQTDTWLLKSKHRTKKKISDRFREKRLANWNNLVILVINEQDINRKSSISSKFGASVQSILFLRKLYPVYINSTQGIKSGLAKD